MLSLKEEREWDRKTYMRVNWEWVEDSQLPSIGAKGTRTAKVVTELLKVLEDNNFKPSEVNELDSIIRYTTSLFKGHPIEPEPVNETWSQDVVGRVNVRDIVRVRRDAYLGSFATKHNGKRGRVVSVRNGLISVAYDGEGIETCPQHKPEYIEKLVIR
jgi:hypothetical protein